MKTKTSYWLYRSLIQLCRKSSRDNQGYMLFFVIAFALALSVLLVSYSMMAKFHSTGVKSSASRNSGFYGAEGVANLRAEQIRQIYLAYGTPNGVSPTSLSACLDSDSTNDGSGDYVCQKQTFAQTNSSLAGIEASSFVVPMNNGEATEASVPSGEPFQGLNMQEYSYSINVASKKFNSPVDQVTSMLQLGFKSRLIPMFQFAAFYRNDLEILPGAAMTLAGPVHTNGNLYLGGSSTSAPLKINSQVTVAGDIYNSRKDSGATYADGIVQIANAVGTFLNLLFKGTGSTTPTTSAMNAALLTSNWGTQIKKGVEALSIPTASILNSSGDFAQKADLRIVFTPAPTNTNSNTTSPDPTVVPFQVTSISRTSSGSITSTTVLTEGELRSLRQPVLLSQALSGTNISDTNYRFCTVPTAATPGVTLTAAQKTAIVNALYVAILSQTTPLAYDSSNPAFLATNETLATAGTQATALKTTFNTLLDTALSGFAQLSTLKTNLGNSTPAAIAALDGRCFVSAPLQDIGRDATTHQSPYRFYNDREGREMRLLQINLDSLTAWNKVGRYVAFSNGTVSNNNTGQGYAADQRLFATASADSGAPVGSFQNLGLAASDVSEGGLVFHASISTTTYTSSNGTQSPYGFALVQGQQLPGLAQTTNNPDPTGLTFVSDQAVYIQGDYNAINGQYVSSDYQNSDTTQPLLCPSTSTSYNCRNWQPASVLADSINILSNACLNADNSLNKDSVKNCNTGSSLAKASPATKATTINAAFLAGTDITNYVSGSSSQYNGGLENYPRFSEDWSGGITLTYRGSFVSTATPLHVSGLWASQAYNPPTRNWNYDTRFNSAMNLPPLCPRFVYLRQESFARNFDQ